MSVFLTIPEDQVLYRDLYPVAPGHSLIISNVVRTDYFALTPEEQQHLPYLLAHCKALIEEEYQPDGYNIGMNCGEVAGQTVPHYPPLPWRYG